MRLFSKMEKSSEVNMRHNNWPKTLPCSIPDTTLTSLLRQPSTITCCDWFDRNYVNIDRTEPPILTEQSLKRMPRWLKLDPIQCCTEVNLHDLSLLPTLQCTLQCMGHAQKRITGTQTFSMSKLGGWKHTTAFRKLSKMNRHQALKHLRRY